jgi:hypothetical protein
MPTKKAVAKKPVTHRRTLKPKALAMEVVSDSMPMPMPALEPMSEPCSTAVERVVYFSGCRNCCHVPLGVNAILTVLVAVIFTLSAMLMAASVVLAA